MSAAIRGMTDACDQFPKLTSQFQQAKPFPHIVVDGFLTNDVIDAMLAEFPSATNSTWDRYEDADIEVKLRSNWKDEFDIPPAIHSVVRYLNSGYFMRQLSAMTGIQHLISDPYYTGGGLNMILPGGLLDVHVDGNWHDQMRVHRRLNLILFLNKCWKREWGGALGFYDDGGQTRIQCYRSRSGAHRDFRNTRSHLPWPPGTPSVSRWRYAEVAHLYYYTAQPRPADQVAVREPHSALWRKRNWLDRQGKKTREPVTWGWRIGLN